MSLMVQKWMLEHALSARIEPLVNVIRQEIQEDSLEEILESDESIKIRFVFMIIRKKLRNNQCPLELISLWRSNMEKDQLGYQIILNQLKAQCILFYLREKRKDIGLFKEFRSVMLKEDEDSPEKIQLNEITQELENQLGKGKGKKASFDRVLKEAEEKYSLKKCSEILERIESEIERKLGYSFLDLLNADCNSGAFVINPESPHNLVHQISIKRKSIEAPENTKKKAKVLESSFDVDGPSEEVVSPFRTFEEFTKQPKQSKTKKPTKITSVQPTKKRDEILEQIIQGVELYGKKWIYIKEHFDLDISVDEIRNRYMNK